MDSTTKLLEDKEPVTGIQLETLEIYDNQPALFTNEALITPTLSILRLKRAGNKNNQCRITTTHLVDICAHRGITLPVKSDYRRCDVQLYTVPGRKALKNPVPI